MHMLKNLFPVSEFLYLLQLEEYETRRYFRLLPRFFWRRNLQKRGQLVWTKRIKITELFTLPFNILLFPLTPIWIGMANAILNPYFESIKIKIHKRATKRFIKAGKNTKVILITGSFGKTTTKNYIHELIKYNYKTQMIPGNINTVTGIANWINTDFNNTTQILVAEADPYYIGEIKKVCEIIPPDIAIITYIGDQHLERLGSRENLKVALKEIFEYAKPNAVKIKNLKSNLDYALEVAKVLDIPKDIVKDTVRNLSKPDRRGNIKIMNNFEVIDQSYNISETTAKNAIDEATLISKQKKKDLIVITAGIPELGEENKNANENLGSYLVKKADKIILLKSVLYTEVMNSSDKFLLASDLEEAWKILENFDPKKNIILILPELNDLYY
jgi:UDP-N-acetylmuramyl pentapeptide synthase